jgi:Co/Zn/Cd efflux system component
MADHAHTLPVGSKLRFGIMLTTLILVLEVTGGLLSHSLALLSDAGHVLADILALSLSWYGVKQAAEIRREIENVLRQRFHIKHTVLQMECQKCGCNDVFCKLTFESSKEK